MPMTQEDQNIENLNKPLTVIVAGDLAPIHQIEQFCSNKNYNYEQLFNDSVSILKDKDLSVINLECPLTRKSSPIKKCGPNFKANPSCINLLKYAGFDVVTLANNHILDHGTDGLTDTLNLCEQHKIRFVGAGANLEEASKPLTIEVRGKLLTFLNFAENEFSIASIDKAGANPLNPMSNYNQIMSAKKYSDYVILIIHGGNESYPLPNPNLRETCRFFSELGASAIILHHTHTPSGYEIYNKVPIFYGLGNFLFPRKKEYVSHDPWYEGFFVKLYLKEYGQIDFKIFPYYQNKGRIGLNLMNAEEKKLFLAKLENYNTIIRNDHLLRQEWEIHCQKNKIEYLSYFLMLNFIERQFFKRNIFTKRLIKEEKFRYILNIIRCESHRDSIIKALELTLNS